MLDLLKNKFTQLCSVLRFPIWEQWKQESCINCLGAGEWAFVICRKRRMLPRYFWTRHQQVHWIMCRICDADKLSWNQAAMKVGHLTQGDLVWSSIYGCFTSFLDIPLLPHNHPAVDLIFSTLHDSLSVNFSLWQDKHTHCVSAFKQGMKLLCAKPAIVNVLHLLAVLKLLVSAGDHR